MGIAEHVAALSHAGLIAVICEGGAETVIMDILLDNDLLLFSRERMINSERIIPRISAREFQNRYLRVAYDEKLYILRVIDSRAEEFPLTIKDPYKHQIEVIRVITAPEIEMLIIVHEGKLKEYSKSGKKPSEFCKTDLGYKNVKRQSFVRAYFADPQTLVDSIRAYHRVHRQKAGELSLFDLLKG